MNSIHNDSFVTTLTASTADLINRYGECDEEGRIVRFNIINEELIGALRSAAEWLERGFLSNESLSQVWSRPSPCAECPEREDCHITCRRKHAFDKEVYGALLCGNEAAGVQHVGEEENMVHFKVHLTAENRLIFRRDVGYTEGAIELLKNGGVGIDGRAINLRPWSAALYRMFVLHPEGFPLSQLGRELKGEFVRNYKNISQSTVKVAKLKEQLADIGGLSHLVNNKLSELNKQLRAEGVGEIFIPRTTQHKANNKPYFIPYLNREK